MSTIVVESKPVTFIRQIYEPLSAAVTTTATVYIVATGSEDSISYVVIPKDYLKANLASGISAILTITTGVASTETCIIPIAPSDSTVSNNGLMLQIYVDTSGNVYGENFSISGYVSGRGWWKKDADGTLMQEIILTLTGVDINVSIGSLYRSATYGGGLWPIAFNTIYSCIWSVQQELNNLAWIGTPNSSPSTTNSNLIYIISAISGTGSNITLICKGSGRWKA